MLSHTRRKKNFKLSVCILYLLCSLQSTFCIQSALCILHFVLTGIRGTYIMHSVLEQRKQWQKQYISIGKTDLFYNSTGLCGNLTPQNTSVGVNTTFSFFSVLILFPFVKIIILLLSYLLVYKSTFYDQKFSPKTTLDLYTSHTQRLDPSNPGN